MRYRKGNRIILSNENNKKKEVKKTRAISYFKYRAACTHSRYVDNTVAVRQCGCRMYEKNYTN